MQKISLSIGHLSRIFMNLSLGILKTVTNSVDLTLAVLFSFEKKPISPKI